MRQSIESIGHEREGKTLNAKTIGGPRGLLRCYILYRLSKEEMSGYDLISSLNTLTGGTWRPASGSIYPILQSLKKEKLIDVVSRQNRSKQIYAVTPKGKQFLQTQSNLLNEFAVKWNKIRLALLDLISPENLSTFIMENTKANRLIWPKIIEKNSGSVGGVIFSLKEYKLLLESELDWVEQEIKELARVRDRHPRY